MTVAMRRWRMRTSLIAGLLVAAALGAVTEAPRAEAPRPDAPMTEAPDWRVLRGACYCRAATELRCTADLTERDCRRRCDEALCNDWFWLERRPCWNWGYGGERREPAAPVPTRRARHMRRRRSFGPPLYFA